MTAPLPPAPGGPDFSGGDPTSVMGRRSLAWFLDLVVFLVVIIGLYASMAETVDIPTGFGDGLEACEQLESVFGTDRVASCAVFGDTALVLDNDSIGIQTLATVGYFAVFVLMQGLIGASPGKLLTGLRVVNRFGERAGVGRSLGRTLLWIVDGAPWFAPLVGFIVGLTSTGHRRIGDMAAGTYVIASSRTGQPVMADASQAPPAGAQAWGAPPPPVGSTWSSPAPTTPPPGNWPPPAARPTGQQPTPAPPTPGPPMDPRASGVPTTAAGTAWTPDQAPVPDPELRFEGLDVPPPTEAADIAPPTVEADPEWGREPEGLPDAGIAADPLQEPAWEPPTTAHDGPTEAPTMDPMADWAPPSSAFDDGTEASADPGHLTDDGRVPEASAPVDGGRADISADTGVVEPERPGAAPFAAPGAEAGAPIMDPAAKDPWGTTATPGDEKANVRYELPPPQWDPARNTYIQWDPNQQHWLQWDAQGETWKLIDS